MATPGRKRLLTPELQNDLCDILEGGTSIKDACAIVGIGERTFHEWVEIGLAHLNGGNHRRMPRKIADREMMAQFAQSTMRARATMRQKVVDVMYSRARAGDIHAAEFLLERTDPENWGRQTRIKLDVNITLVQEFIAAVKQSGQQPDLFMQRVIERARRDPPVQ